MFPTYQFVSQVLQDALPALLDAFQRLDVDQSGFITKGEIAHVSLDMMPPKLLDNVSVDSMVDLFELLDVDNGGELSQSEFVEGHSRIAIRSST